MSLISILQPQPAGRSAGSDDQGTGLDPLAFHVEAERTLREIGIDDRAVQVFGAEVDGLLLHVLHQVGPVDPFGKAGEVLDQGGHGKLAASLVSGDDQRLQIGARRVNRGGISGTAGAHNNDVSHWIWW